MNENIIHNDNGDLTILKEWLEPHPHINKPNRRIRKALVRCYCRKEFVTRKTRLLDGKTKSCGCYKSKRTKEMYTTHGHAANCTPTYVTWNGKTKSCGCYKSKRTKEMHTTHGHAANCTPTYVTWKGVKRRCLNPNAHSYSTTENLGIKVCPEWLKFEGFLKDMGVKPPRHRLSRINKDGDFEPKNCEWLPLKRFKTNKRTRKNATR